jgi:hypothetical protein
MKMPSAFSYFMPDRTAFMGGLFKMPLAFPPLASVCHRGIHVILFNML